MQKHTGWLNMTKNIECEWCARPISAPIVVEKKSGEVWQYQACDKDCAHGLDVLDRIEEILYDSIRLSLMGKHHLVLATSESDSPEEELLTLPPMELNLI